MADEEEGEAVEGGGSKKKLIIFAVIGVLLLIGTTVGITLLLVGGGDDDEVVEEATEEVVEEVRGDPHYIDLKPPFTVNLDPEDPVQFLQISIQVLTFDATVANELEKHLPLIRNNLLILFGQQRSEDLRSPGGKEVLQQKVLDVVQAVINEQGSAGPVDSVFFTNFVMQ